MGTLPLYVAIPATNNADNTVWLLELTVRFKSNVDTAHTRKKLIYTTLSEDIQEAVFEIGFSIQHQNLRFLSLHHIITRV
jgi:hypothetical protein